MSIIQSNSSIDYIEKNIDTMEIGNWYQFLARTPFRYRTEILQILYKANINVDPNKEVAYCIFLNGADVCTPYAFDKTEKYFLINGSPSVSTSRTARLLFRDFEAAFKFQFKICPSGHITFIKSKDINWDPWIEVDTNMEIKGYIHINQVEYLQRKQGEIFGIF